MFISIISYKMNACFGCVIANNIRVCYKYPCAALFTQRTTNYDQKPPTSNKSSIALTSDGRKSRIPCQCYFSILILITSN